MLLHTCGQVYFRAELCAQFLQWFCVYFLCTSLTPHSHHNVMADFSLHGLAIRISHVMHLACHRSITCGICTLPDAFFFKVSISTFFKTESLSA